MTRQQGSIARVRAILQTALLAAALAGAAGCGTHPGDGAPRSELSRCWSTPVKGGAAFKCRKDIYARVVDVEGASTMDALKSQIEDMGNDVHGLQFEPQKLDVGGESRDAFHLFAGGGNYYPWAGDIVAAQAGGAVRVALCGGNYTSLTPPLCREILAELLARPVTVP